MNFVDQGFQQVRELNTKYNSYFYCTPHSLTDGALQKSANTCLQTEIKMNKNYRQTVTQTHTTKGTASLPCCICVNQVCFVMSAANASFRGAAGEDS